jgi:CheY-like chemotaxis protein
LARLHGTAAEAEAGNNSPNTPWCGETLNFSSHCYGDSMTTAANAQEHKRIFLVEDELMIRMLVEDMLSDLGHTIAAEAGGIDEALTLAKQGDFDLAILDVNLNGKPITPVVEVLIARGVPFVFASGYGQRGVPEPYRERPTLQKPFQSEALAQAIDAVGAKSPT